MACSRVTEPRAASVLIRVYNNSDYAFDSVRVNGAFVGSIAPAKFSEYASFDTAYYYGAVVAKVQGKWLAIYPIDYVGETPLRNGQYTYMISADPEGDGLSLYFVEGDRLPVGPQGSGRTRVLSVEQRYEGLGGTPAPDGGVVVSGSRWTLTTINPTVSSRSNSRVIYLPNARVYGSARVAVLAALDSAGRVRWTRYLGPEDVGEKVLESLTAAADDGYLAVGRREALELKPGGNWAWKTTGWIARTDASGRETWSRAIGNTSYDRIFFVAPSTDGGFVLAGGTDASAWLVKLDRDGGEQWSRTFQRNGSAEAAAQLPDGGFAVVGDRYGSIKVTDGGWVTRTDAAGSELWTVWFGGSAESVAATMDGGLAIAGTTRNDGGQLIRVDTRGLILWQQTYPACSNVRALTPVADGGYALAGTRSSRFWLIRTDASGKELWSRSYADVDSYNQGGADEGAHALVPMRDGGFTLVGRDGQRLLVVRTDAVGTVLWSRVVGEN